MSHTNKKEIMTEVLFYLFPAPAGSAAPAVGFSLRLRDFSLPAGIPLAVSNIQFNLDLKKRTRLNKLKS